MWRKIFIVLMGVFAVVNSYAQTVPSEVSDSTGQSVTLTPQPIFGYLSYDSALTSMAQYVLVEQQMDELRQAYEAEMQRVEEEFNQKYEAFLEGRRDFPRTILLKRQTELQQLLQRNVEFKEQCKQELAKARADALAPLRQQLNRAIATVARQHRLIMVVNTDADATPFIEPAFGLDITDEVSRLLSDESTND